MKNIASFLGFCLALSLCSLAHSKTVPGDKGILITDKGDTERLTVIKVEKGQCFVMWARWDAGVTDVDSCVFAYWDLQVKIAGSSDESNCREWTSNCTEWAACGCTVYQWLPYLCMTEPYKKSWCDIQSQGQLR